MSDRFANKKLKTAKVYIHSKVVDSKSQENFIYNFRSPFYNVVRCALLNTFVPNAFNNITTKNNVLKITEVNGGVNLTVTIPVGYYPIGANSGEADTLLKALKDGLEAASALGANSYTYNVATDPNTNSIAISTSGSAQLSMTVDSTNTIANTLGFYNTKLNQTLLLSDSPFDLSVPETIYVLSNAMGKETEMNNRKYNIMSEIPIRSAYGDYSFNTDKHFSDFIEYDRPIDIDRVDLRLVDELAEQVSLQNIGWRTTLYIEYYDAVL